MWKLVTLCLVLCSLTGILGVDGDCGEGRECRLGEECPGFMEERSRLQSMRRGSGEYRALLRELKRLVCNKKWKAVCCDKELTITTTTRIEDNFSSSWLPSLKKQECGLSAETAAFVVGGNETKLGEFPWTVLLGKRSGVGGQTFWHCGGTLVNAWYVLTAAHCGPRVDMVRVGEWEVEDTSKPDLDTCNVYSEDQRRRCERFCGFCGEKTGDVDCMCQGKCGRGAENVCAEKHQDIEVAEVKTHESYGKLPTGIVINDIMLVKLKYPAHINSFASPVCLPDEQERKRIELFGEQGAERVLSYGKPIVVGWGQTYTEADEETSIVSSARQQQLALPVVSNQQCADKYSQLFRRDVSADIRIGEHLCAGGVRGQDSCNGDSGGPLIGREGAVSPYILVGVVSAGTKTCAIGAPGIFTRVTSYMDWIVQNLK
eukprot:GFUD01037517.1.p1 GENE.GFUD01037517.1~~GFUD01037517.1.p1  ORF type:complete len:430 (+),score=115.47 GFUD01037517.1:90-1379(+)